MTYVDECVEFVEVKLMVSAKRLNVVDRAYLYTVRSRDHRQGHLLIPKTTNTAHSPSVLYVIIQSEKTMFGS